jgi:hypothetical protein
MRTRKIILAAALAMSMTAAHAIPMPTAENLADFLPDAGANRVDARQEGPSSLTRWDGTPFSFIGFEGEVTSDANGVGSLSSANNFSFVTLTFQAAGAAGRLAANTVIPAGGSITVFIDGEIIAVGDAGRFFDLFVDGANSSINMITELVAQIGVPASLALSTPGLSPPSAVDLGSPGDRIGIIIEWPGCDVTGRCDVAGAGDVATASVFSLVPGSAAPVPEASTLVVMLAGGMAMLLGALRRRA